MLCIYGLGNKISHSNSYVLGGVEGGIVHFSFRPNYSFFIYKQNLSSIFFSPSPCRDSYSFVSSDEVKGRGMTDSYSPSDDGL